MKKTSSIALTLSMAAALAAFPGGRGSMYRPPAVFAAQAEDSIIHSRTGSIRIVRTDSDKNGVKDVSMTIYRVVKILPDPALQDYMTLELDDGFKNSPAKDLKADELQNYSAAQLEALAGSLERYVVEEKMQGISAQTAADGSAVFSGLELGWYLVRESATPTGYLPTAPFLIAVPSTLKGGESDSWVYDVEAKPKAPSIPMDKTITNAAGAYENTKKGNADADTAAEGDVVEYSVTSVIPAYSDLYFASDKTPVFRITDLLSDGLTIDPSSVHVYVKDGDSDRELKAGSQIRVEAEAVDSPTVPDLTVTFLRDCLMAESNKGKQLKLVYSAVVNKKAVMGTAGNPNKAALFYDNSPYCTEPEKLEDETKVYCFGIRIDKYDSDDSWKKALPGAVFALYKEPSAGAPVSEVLAGEGKSLTADSSGQLVFSRLDAGTYYLKETKAPEGYSLLTNPVKVEILPNASLNADGVQIVSDGSFRLRIDGKEVNVSGSETEKNKTMKIPAAGLAVLAAGNHKGFTLPATGGRGIAGMSAAAFLAMCLLVFVFFKDRRGKREEKGHGPAGSAAGGEG